MSVPPKKILVISLAGIGDTLMATPLIREFRTIYPDAIIDVFVMWRGAYDTLQGNPYVNTVFFRNLIHENKFGSLKFLRMLARRKYDISINTHPQSKLEYRFVARLINARMRLSHNYHHSPWYGRLLGDRTIPQDYEKHSVEQTMDLLPFIGLKPVLPSHEYDLFLTPEEFAWAEQFIRERNLAGKKLFAFHVGTSGTKNLALRRWPVKHYIGLIRRFHQNHPDVSILLFGGPEEVQLHAEILANVPHDRVFEVKSRNFRESAALLRRCDMVISGDTSIMHLGSAVKVPWQFVLETPTFYKPNYPYGRPFVLIRNPGVNGENLKYYLYDGHGIKGTPDQLRALMASITVDQAYETIRATCPFLQGKTDIGIG